LFLGFVESARDPLSRLKSRFKGRNRVKVFYKKLKSVGIVGRKDNVFKLREFLR